MMAAASLTRRDDYDAPLAIGTGSRCAAIGIISRAHARRRGSQLRGRLAPAALSSSAISFLHIFCIYASTIEICS